MIEALTGSLGIYVASFAIAVISGVVPIVNAELYLIAACVAVGQVPAAIAIAVLVALGQMVAKAGIYRAARCATELGKRHSGKHAAKLDRARKLVEKHGSKPLSLTFLSASVGLPPFYVVSIVAGMLAVRFQAFFMVGLAGRTLRFGTIAVIAAIA